MITERQAPLNLLEEISAFCKTEHIAESTFGKRAVNEGKATLKVHSGLWFMTSPMSYPKRETSRDESQPDGSKNLADPI